MILALDIGGTYTKYAYIENGAIIQKDKWNTAFSREALLKKIAQIATKPFDYIAISSGGFWTKDGVCIAYATIRETADGEFTRILRETYACDVFINNDARCAMLCESEYGATRDIDNAVIFVLGSSLGCAVKLNGKIIEGASGQAAAMFAMPELIHGSEYVYDNYANSIMQIRKFKTLKNIYSCDMLRIENEYRSGDSAAKQIIFDYTNAIAVKCWYAYLMYDPSCILFGGGISNSDLIIDLIHAKLKELFIMDKSKRLPIIMKTQMGENSNLIGATLLKKCR